MPSNPDLGIMTLDVESWRVTKIEEGIKQADQGLVASGVDVDWWLASWGTSDELTPPKPLKSR